ncbi:MAG: uracil-DNA glycosylase family protein [Flavisolibacter sp.]
MTWADHLISFYKNLQPPADLPGGIEWLYPQKDPACFQIVEAFLHKFYADSEARRIFLGINPGRFGAGITGVNFTASRQLSDHCGIDHPFKKGTELSAEFIYEMIEAYGGAEKFYRNFFIGSVCPLGFVRNGKNLNYYDDKELLDKIGPFVIQSLNHLLDFHVDRSVVYCIGGEKNYRYLSSINERHHWFETVVPLPHPRFIMQYKRKQKEFFIEQYLKAIG